MDSAVLNLNQTPQELVGIYRQDYYWYLHSPPFHKAFLEVLGRIVNRLACPCLDVACGEGWLADYVDVPYVGFDGSAVAIGRARRKRPHGLFSYGRIENPSCSFPPHGTIVFGGILSVLVKPEKYIDFLETYLLFLPRHYIIYDLERTDLSAVDRRFRIVEEYHATADLPEIGEVKCQRKIMVYRCHP